MLCNAAGDASPAKHAEPVLVIMPPWHSPRVTSRSGPVCAALQAALTLQDPWAPQTHPGPCRAGLDLLKVLVVIAVGMPLSLWATARIAVTVRSFASTELQPSPPMAPNPPFTQAHRVAWGAAAVLALMVVILSSSAQVGPWDREPHQRLGV